MYFCLYCRNSVCVWGGGGGGGGRGGGTVFYRFTYSMVCCNHFYLSIISSFTNLYRFIICLLLGFLVWMCASNIVVLYVYPVKKRRKKVAAITYEQQEEEKRLILNQPAVFQFTGGLIVIHVFERCRGKGTGVQ